jgi:DNA polymerase I-like protein with 3'-5' exonuclease and polymerase domains
MIVTNNNVAIALTALKSANEIAVDTETTGLNVRNGVDYLIGISVYTDSGFGAYFPFRHEEGSINKQYAYELAAVLAPKNLIWHNRKFDMHSLRTIGIDPLVFTGIQYDTILLFHLWNEEFFSFELDVIAKVFLKDPEGKIDSELIHKTGQLYGYEKVPVSVMGPYAIKDTELTYRAQKFVWPKLIKEGLDKVYLETEMPFTTILYEMEQRGVGVNREFVERKAHVGNTRMSTIKRELKFNPASTNDLKRVLIDELGENCRISWLAESD